jgi:SAM-dependent methyltransferase
MAFDETRQAVARYYAALLREHGATPRGVDWNSDQSQRLRFHQLLRVVADPGAPFSLIDYGCGYGGLLDTLGQRGWPVSYVGFDVAAEMIDEARRRFPARGGVDFVQSDDDLAPADYAVASGIFNVKLDHGVAAWEEYVWETIDRLSELGRRGFAFNLLTSYSDTNRMRPDLYYGDSLVFFDRCKRTYSRNVALLHDYDLYEWTLIVRR